MNDAMDVVKKTKKRKFFDEEVNKENCCYKNDDGYFTELLFTTSKQHLFDTCDLILDSIHSREQQIRVVMNVLRRRIQQPKTDNSIFKRIWYSQWISVLCKLNEFMFPKLVDEYLGEVRHRASFGSFFNNAKLRKLWCEHTTLTDFGFIQIIKNETIHYNSSFMIIEILEKNGFNIQNHTYNDLLDTFIQQKKSGLYKNNYASAGFITLLEVATRKRISLQFTKDDIYQFFVVWNYDATILKLLNHFFTFNYIEINNIFQSIDLTNITLIAMETILSFSTSLTITEHKCILSYISPCDIQNIEVRELIIKTRDQLMFLQPDIMCFVEELRNIQIIPDCLICLIAIYVHGTLIESLKDKERKRLLFELSLSKHEKNYKVLV